MSDRVVIVAYDPDWPRRFERERALLNEVFSGCAVVVEHVGSTAVPGLAAKPVVDVMLGVRALGEVERRIEALASAGYDYVPEYERELPDRRYFRKSRDGARAFHLHCVVEGSDFWTRHLAFRDYLRAHPGVAAAYESLKRELASTVTKSEYTDAKSPFIERVLADIARAARTAPTTGSHAGAGSSTSES